MSMADEDNAAGAIDTSDDNSGAAPVAASPPGQSYPGMTPAQDDSGTSPKTQSPQGAPPQEDQSRSGVDFNASHVPGNTKRIIAYLMGADAAHPQTIDQLGAQVDPEGKLHPSDRNLLAIDAAREQGGDQAAWQLMQSNRVAYNAQTAFAKTALQGTPQKPADLNAAIDAANKAQSNVLDGSSIQFAPSQGGVTATVTMHGTTQPQVIPLSMQAFSQFLDVGGDGQWDKIMDQGAPATLQRLSQQNPAQQAPRPANSTPTLNPRKAQWPTPPQAAASPAPQAQAPATTQKVDPWAKAFDDAADPSKTNYGEELETRANAMFGANNSATTRQRQEWMAAQEQQDLNRNAKIEEAREKGVQANERARITGGSRERVAETTAKGKLEGWKYSSDAKQAAAQIAADAKAAQAGNKQAQDRVESARKVIAAKRATGATITPEDEALEKQLVGRAGAAPQPAAAQAPQAPTPQAQQPPVPGAKPYKGQWYTRGPNGESVPVQ